MGAPAGARAGSEDSKKNVADILLFTCTVLEAKP
jgi:hypothetical protein